jgi:hypothetical protein
MFSQIKIWIATAASLALCVGALACGNSGNRNVSTVGPGTYVTAYFPHDPNDRDNDGDRNNDDGAIDTGQLASPAEGREMKALVKRYYAAAAAANGSEACALLVPFIAESVVESYGKTQGVTGRTCAAVMTKIFEGRHAQLAPESATLRIPEVRLEPPAALVILEFPTIPEVRQIRLRRVGASWRVLALVDGAIE